MNLRTVFAAATLGALAFLTIPTAAAAAPVASCTAADVTVSGDLSTGHATVTLKHGHADCVVSLNSYATAGPTWPTSGTQTFTDHASAVVTGTNSLTVTVPAGNCQVDVYGSTIRFDGADGPVPHYPDAHISNRLKSFNGGCTPPPSPSCGPTTETPCPTTTPTPSPTPTTSGSSSPTPTATPTPKVSMPPSSSSPTTLVVTPTPPVTPTATPPSGVLPFTGGPPYLLLVLGGIGLLFAGFGALRSARRPV